MLNSNASNEEEKRFFYIKISISIFVFSVSLINSLTEMLVPEDEPVCIEDKTHNIFNYFNSVLKLHGFVKKIILVINGLAMDSCLISLVYAWITYGKSWKPVMRISLFLLFKFLLKNIFLEKLPDGDLLEFPGIPSLVMSYSKTNDLFFSGHIGILFLIGTELWDFRSYSIRLKLMSFLCFAMLPWLSVFELSIRSAYSLDILIGIISAHYCTFIPEKLVGHIDNYFFLDDTNENIEINFTEL
jgi:hypothetical protein